MSMLLNRLLNLNNKQGIVNVRMVITEEKILSNIEKVQKMINPKSKKQIVQLEEDTYFKDLVESIKTYLEEYPKKKNFPRSVYKAAYDLVEFATNQFEENTKKIEELIIQREKNIGLAFELKTTLSKVIKREENANQEIDKASGKFSEDVIEALRIIAGNNEPEEKKAARKLIDARINNLESNFHIEIDMERIEDKSKALSYIGIEIAEALKYIPAPVEEVANVPMQAEPVLMEQPTKAGSAKKAQARPQQQVQKPQMQQQPQKQPMKQPQKQQRPQVAATSAPAPKKAQMSMGGATNMAAATAQPKKYKPTNQIFNQVQQEQNDDKLLSDMYMQETRFDVKPTLLDKLKNSKFIRTLKYVMRIRVVLELPALPEGRGENNG